MPRKASKQLAAARAKLPLITQPRSASAGATTPVRRPALEDASPHTAWQEAIGEVLSPSVSKKDRNRRLHAYTPYGAHLERESLEWLERHQTGAVAKMERRQSKVVQVPKTPREAASVAPLERLETGSWGAVRQPPRVAPGERPQVLLLQMEGLLAESFHRSLWTGDASLHARPGVIPGLLALRKTYILCALCAAAPPAASRMLAELRRRGLRFDLAFSLPASMAARGAAPCLGEAAALQLCNAIDASRADLGRRALLLSALELDTAEIEGRSGGELLCSPTKRRPHVKLLLPGVPTLLVPTRASSRTKPPSSPPSSSVSSTLSTPSPRRLERSLRRRPAVACPRQDGDAAPVARTSAPRPPVAVGRGRRRRRRRPRGRRRRRSERRAFPRRVPAPTAQGAPRAVREMAVAGGRR